jgi:hypothetical protein
LGWGTVLTAIAAAWLGAAWAGAVMRRLPSSIGDFEGMHLER